jgi:hypothetical protein
MIPFSFEAGAGVELSLSATHIQLFCRWPVSPVAPCSISTDHSPTPFMFRLPKLDDA